MTNKATKGELTQLGERLGKLEQDVYQAMAVYAKGLDTLSRVVEVQTGTLARLLEFQENNAEALQDNQRILNQIAGVVEQLNVANQEAKGLYLGAPNRPTQE